MARNKHIPGTSPCVCDTCGTSNPSTIAGKPHRRCGGGRTERVEEGGVVIEPRPNPIRAKGDLIAAEGRGTWQLG